MKRILIISYYWPPKRGVGVQRWLKLSKYLTRDNHELIIYTPEYMDTNLKEPSVLVLGSEKEGVSNKIINISNELIKIPTNGDIISLNVSVAAGIILSELQRQRNLN